MRFLDRKVPLVTPIKMKQKQVRSSPEGGNCEDGLKTARSFQLGHPPNWPSWSRVRSSSAIRRTGLIQIGGCRAGRVIDPARPSAELDCSARRMAELVVLPIQLGHPPKWTGPARRVFGPARPSADLDWFSLADGRAGRVVDPARPSAELVVWSIQLGHPPTWTVCSVHTSIKRA